MIKMTRAELKRILDIYRPSPFAAEMIDDPLFRARVRICERYRRDLAALYAKRGLTEERRRKGYERAAKRYEAAQAKLQPLRERFNREVWIPLLRDAGILKPGAEPRRGSRYALF